MCFVMGTKPIVRHIKVKLKVKHVKFPPELETTEQGFEMSGIRKGSS